MTADDFLKSTTIVLTHIEVVLWNISRLDQSQTGDQRNGCQQCMIGSLRLIIRISR